MQGLPQRRKKKNAEEQKEGGKKYTPCISHIYTEMESGPKAGRGLKLLGYEVLSY
jgi:hypothetical protein